MPELPTAISDGNVKTIREGNSWGRELVRAIDNEEFLIFAANSLASVAGWARERIRARKATPEDQPHQDRLS